jgi:hypothetical protein
MKTKLSLYVASLFLVTSFLSCKKANVAPIGTSAFTIVNAIVGSSGLDANFDSNVPLKYYSNYSTYISYGSFQEFSGYNGEIPLSLVDDNDTTKALYSNTLNFPVGSIHSLFLCGTLAAPDNFLTTDALPYHPDSDSSLSIRFVNLSPGSNPVSVNITGDANGSEVGTMAYKNITAFKNYSAKGNISSYTFEFHDLATGNLLGSYTIRGINNGVVNSNPNQFRWRNFTLAIYDVPGNQNTMLINNY